MTPIEFLSVYEQRTNTHRFAEVAPLIAEDAIYWFSEGSFQGLAAIKQAFEKTWAYIQDEHYAIEQVQWLANDEQVAVCIYLFRWQGKVEGQLRQGIGRGTSVLQQFAAGWKVTHEHLSSLPTSQA
jgi:ketosteroid isomerase-like protein